MTFTVKGYGATEKGSKIVLLEIERRDVGPLDVVVDVEYCGICHSDLHACHGDWLAPDDPGRFPLCPGHEILGKVSKVGAKVTKFKVGDRAAIGTLSGSCGNCYACENDMQMFCPKLRLTYGGQDPDFPGKPHQGGYSEKMVVTEDFVFHVPESLYKPAAAPLLCAGITTYSPLVRNNIGKGMKVGVIGLGGLGHMGVKFANALGAETWVITTSASKAKTAHELGAKGVVISTDAKDMKKNGWTFDFLLNTVPKPHHVNDYFKLLKLGSTMCVVGNLQNFPDIMGTDLIIGNKKLEGSAVGGLKQTQEMLEFCAKNNIVSDIENATYDKINETWDRVEKNDVRYRFVLDNKTL